MIFSVAYQYRKSMSICIYIKFLASYFRDPSHCLAKFTGCQVGDNRRTVIHRRVRIFLISWGQKTCEKQSCWFIVVLWVLVWKNMYRYERHFGSFHRYYPLLMFPIAQSTWSNLPKLTVRAAQRHHSWNAYLTSMFGHYIGGYIIN